MCIHAAKAVSAAKAAEVLAAVASPRFLLELFVTEAWFGHDALAQKKDAWQ